MHHSHRTLGIGVALVSLLTLSCNGDDRFKPVYPVRGQVLFDGKPAAGAAVTLHPVDVDDHPWTKPSAEADDRGHFAVNTYRSGDGAPAGTYEVTVVWLPPNYAGPLERGNKLPARYASRSTSGIRIEVKDDDNELPPFQLTR